MKNQYFGDLYDYIKYGLLRQLSRRGKLSTAVCWMLTENDERRDGHRVSYLHKPEEWRSFDPPVFDCLREAVLSRKERNTRALEESGLLDDTIFYTPLLGEGLDERRTYFDEFLSFSKERDIVFFDPDNGLEVKSVKYGRKGSSRYLFMREVSRTVSAGHTVLVYQHMPHRPREPFINHVASRLMRETDLESVFVFHSTRIAFFLVPQINHLDQFSEIASRVHNTWASVLNTRHFTPRNVDLHAAKGLPSA